MSLLWLGAVPGVADWPTARGNGGRTGAAPLGPAGPLAPAWTLETGAPSSAWPGEARGSLWQKLDTSLTPRAADDLAPVPVISQGLVLLATTQDEVRAVELDTGRVRWRHICGGPVRFAPAVSGSHVVVGADDGWVQALDLQTGSRVWSTRIGPDRPRVIGNGRLISPCPIRTGLLVGDGTVYVAAGLFPIEGTYLAALDARDGAIRWRRHLASLSPQGYLADAGNEIVVPLGRASPKLYRKRDGSFVRDVPSASGTLAVVADNETLSGPGPTGSIQGGDVQSGAKLVSYPGRQMAVTPTTAYLVNGLELSAYDRKILRETRGNLDKARRWRADCSGGSALIVAGDRVYAGASDRVEVLDAATGALLQTLDTRGPVTALAADADGMVAVTRTGAVHAFRSRSERPPAAATTPADRAPATETSLTAPNWLRELDISRGLILWTNPRDPVEAVRSLLPASAWHVIIAVPEAEVTSARLALTDAGLHGTRAAVMARRADGSVPVVDHLFNAVVTEDLAESEVRRLACPAPSGWEIRSSRVTPMPADPAAGTWTHLYGTAGNVCASTQSLSGFPRLQWFGGHGPERMPDRHTRGHAPLAAGGLVLSMAENALIATDARNGTLRWELELPDSMRYAMPYDAGYAVLREDGGRAVVAVDGALWEIETRHGGVVNRIPCPLPGRHWGWAALDGDALFGSAEDPRAPRTRKEFELVDLDYRSERPLVCSEAVFRAGRDGRAAPDWIQTSGGVFVNATLCAARGRVYAVEARGPAARSRREGRLTCAEILEDAFVVCWDGATGRPLWEKPLRWAEAKDILGLAISGDRLLLSAAQSVGTQASYHLRCWSASEGSELWQSRGMNPIHDLYHGQQVKRPVVLRDKVSFESDVFDLSTGSRWTPPGAPANWILSRPGHACGGMTGADGGLLFRADNPTFFRFADGSFSRLAPTRPGCWLNILPVQGGVVIPEASASCVCEYPIQTSMAFAFDREPVPVLADVLPASR